MPQNAKNYPIGKSNTPWNQSHKKQWLNTHGKIIRNYGELVLDRIEAMPDHLTPFQYGYIEYFDRYYPLFALITRKWNIGKPVALISAGVHGYESSGVFGALEFAEANSLQYDKEFNFIIVPCVSPWGFETINRWNPLAKDPNRSFHTGDQEVLESRLLEGFLKKFSDHILMHIDLHETTNTDELEFRPALAARDGKPFEPGHIPLGFYLVADSDRNDLGFQTAIINAVKKVTHIAQADKNGELLNTPSVTEGVIYYPMTSLGLCGSVTKAKYHSTTEVYPDAPGVSSEECHQAQIAAIKGSLDYLLNLKP